MLRFLWNLFNFVFGLVYFSFFLAVEMNYKFFIIFAENKDITETHLIKSLHYKDLYICFRLINAR